MKKIKAMPNEDMPTIVMIADDLDDNFMEQFVKENIQRRKNLGNHFWESHQTYGFTAANTPKELKEIADYIAPTYQEDGMAHVIEKFL